MSKKFNYLTFIARVQPPHKAHIETIHKALELADKVIILIGSANQPRTIKNPWVWQERKEMISACFSKEDSRRLIFSGISDTYNDQEWVRNIQNAVWSSAEPDAKIGLIGYEKDSSSYYLKLFPQWEFYAMPCIDDINATDVRRMMFELEQIDKNIIPEEIHAYLEAFMNTKLFAVLKEEYEYIQKYHLAWVKSPYPPTFVTVDAVVVQAGHVLLVRRRSAPGKGLWACSGGFIAPNERLEDGMLRELREETKLKVPLPVLRGNIKAREVYDNPSRSFRGRTITHAYLIELPPGPLPPVKGADDADKARWVPLDVFERMQDQMFEDHFFIIKDMLEKL